MKVIVAKNYREFMEFIIENNFDKKDCFFVTDAWKIRGFKMKLEDVFYVGTYYQRKDIDEIRQVINARIRASK